MQPPSFESRFTEALPADPDTSNQRRQVFGACYSRVEPTPVSAPETVAFSRELADELELDDAWVRSSEFAQAMAGNRLLPGMDPYAMCYGGHQFGHWAGQLGDGRAINLGELPGESGERWVLQLKGAGPTPYSRTADGRAVLRSSVREFLCSEAMHHLGVPTTRALSLVTTGEDVVRDMFYDGNPAPEPGAIVCRVAPSFLRFGSYELFSSRQEFGPLRSLLAFTTREHFPELGDPEQASTWVAWFEEVGRRTADLIVEWMRVGFVHGVMNTDNLSILGLTIDYGPYGWLDDYDPNWTPNTTDAQGRRYRFGHQPQIGMWNLVQLGNAIAPVVEDTEALQAAVNAYADRFQDGWFRMMGAKLGLSTIDHGRDAPLFEDLQRLLQANETDMTIFFRQLSKVDPGMDFKEHAPLPEPLVPALYDENAPNRNDRELAAEWFRRYAERLERDEQPPAERRDAMNRVNPKYVLRNYVAQLGIDAAENGDPSVIHELLETLRRPYDEQPERERFAARRPDWARSRPGCSQLSCSS